jgi:hypothetical protein
MADNTSLTCDATAPDTLVVRFPGTVDDATIATSAKNYEVQVLTGPNASDSPKPLEDIATIRLGLNNTTAFITLTQGVGNALILTGGQWIQITIKNVKIGRDDLMPNSAATQVRDVGDVGEEIAANTGSTSKSVEDLAAFSLLTEEIGYPPSPLARPSGGGGAMAPAAGGTLGQIAAKAVSDVLGWQAKTDPKGFFGALNASFKLEEVEGHTKAIWVPRTYAIQTDLSGGITGAQASVYKRAKDALDQSLPLLDGLYPLNKEAKDEDVAALRATVRTQFTDLVNELGLPGGPRIARVTQLFSLLLGAKLPTAPPPPGRPSPAVISDPDLIGGSLGNLRSLFGFGKDDDQVNTVEDEQDLTNFRIVADYITSLAQTWVNNLQFFGVGTKTPFYGTQLVLLTRQLSVIAESVNEVRFTLDSVFIGPAERQTLQINFGSPAPANTPPMFLEDLLTWIDSFASEEGPRLIQDGGKFAVGESFVPIGTQLQTLVAGAVTPANKDSLPRGYRTARVHRSLQELSDQLQELVNLAAPISHVITPEPGPALSVLGISPHVLFLNAVGSTTTLPVTITGTGFDTAISDFNPSDPTAAGLTINAPGLSFQATMPPLSENFIAVQLAVRPPPAAGNYVVSITVTNRDGKSASLQTGFIVLP